MESAGTSNEEDDVVTVFRLSAGGTGEMELETVRGLLESNGISTVLVGDQPLPILAEEIRVSKEDADRARELIQQALADGPAAAAEAEAEGEKRDI